MVFIAASVALLILVLLPQSVCYYFLFRVLELLSSIALGFIASLCGHFILPRARTNSIHFCSFSRCHPFCPLLSFQQVCSRSVCFQYDFMSLMALFCFSTSFLSSAYSCFTPLWCHAVPFLRLCISALRFYFKETFILLIFLSSW